VFSELFQQFTPGTTLRFDVSFPTLNVNSPTPDVFAFAILDGSQGNIPTNAVAGGDTLLRVDIDKTSFKLGDIQVARSIAPGPVGVTATAVPEPASLLLLGSGALLIAFRKLRK
jgi:PEP-CTERM motif